MRLRVELFVEDLVASVAFYTEVLGFVLISNSPEYASVVRGRTVIGLGPIAKLPHRRRPDGASGLGVELVLELDSVADVVALQGLCAAQGVVAEALQYRPWGLHDFRLVDPDGYYLRVTHGDASDPGAATRQGVDAT